MKYLIGVDFGGSSSKATLINEYEKSLFGNMRVPDDFPSVGWAEHDPIEIYNSFITNVRTIFENHIFLPIRLQRFWMQEHILLFF